MSIRNLSILALVLVMIAVVLGGNFGTAIEPPSAEFREYFKYIVTAVLVAFVAYLAMTRR